MNPRGKALLPLMEQLIMTLVFLLAAAVCVRAFVSADQASRRSADRDRALLEAQNVIEAVKSAGHLEEDFSADYAADWSPAGDTARYTLGVYRLPEIIPGLGSAEVWVTDLVRDTELVRIPFGWQEVSGHG